MLEEQRVTVHVDPAVVECALEARVVAEPGARVGQEARQREPLVAAPVEPEERRIEALGRPHEPFAARRSPSASPVSRFDWVKIAAGRASRSS